MSEYTRQNASISSVNIWVTVCKFDLKSGNVINRDLKNSSACCWECRQVYTLENSMEFSQKVKNGTAS